MRPAIERLKEKLLSMPYFLSLDDNLFSEEGVIDTAILVIDRINDERRALVLESVV